MFWPAMKKKITKAVTNIQPIGMRKPFLACFSAAPLDAAREKNELRDFSCAVLVCVPV
jgi:hypothetical protein